MVDIMKPKRAQSSALTRHILCSGVCLTPDSTPSLMVETLKLKRDDQIPRRCCIPQPLCDDQKYDKACRGIYTRERQWVGGLWHRTSLESSSDHHPFDRNVKFCAEPRSCAGNCVFVGIARSPKAAHRLDLFDIRSTFWFGNSSGCLVFAECATERLVHISDPMSLTNFSFSV